MAGFQEVYEEQMEEIKKLENEANSRNNELKKMLEYERMQNIRLTQDMREQEFSHQNDMLGLKLKLAQLMRVYCSDQN